LTDLIPIAYPWDALKVLKGDYKSSPHTCGWYSHIVTTSTSLINAVTGAKFPQRSIGTGYSVYEIHGPAIRGELAQAVTLSDGNSSQITLSIQQGEDIGSNVSLISHFEPFFDQIMDAMLLLVREGLKNDQYKLATHYWPELIEILADNNQDDPAKYALVVDLARPKFLIESLKRISDHPKRVLRRIHDQERVQKVREIDTKCLTDLAKRPGAVLAEKAGPKQRILAIRRTESIDTLENRVTRHCCELITRVAQRYLNEHVNISLHESKRLTSVQKLQRNSIQIPHKDSFRRVRRLLEPCRQPNYTLLQNADYFRVWNAYVELVRNEDLRNNLWKWNRRLWADYMKLYLSTITYAFMQTLGEDTMRLMGNKTVLAERRHSSGIWLLEDSLPGPFIVEPDSKQPLSLYLLEGTSQALGALSNDTEPLYQLNADYIIISSCAGKIKALPIYTLMPSHHLDETAHSVYVEGMLPSLMSSIREFKSRELAVDCVGGWILLGNWLAAEHLPEAQNLKDDQKCWITSVSADARKFTGVDTNWEEPLLTMCGV